MHIIVIVNDMLTTKYIELKYHLQIKAPYIKDTQLAEKLVKDLLSICQIRFNFICLRKINRKHTTHHDIIQYIINFTVNCDLSFKI